MTTFTALAKYFLLNIYPAHIRQSILLLSLSWAQKFPNLKIYAPDQVLSTTNLSNLAKIGISALRIEWHDLQASKMCNFVGHRNHTHWP